MQITIRISNYQKWREIKPFHKNCKALEANTYSSTWVLWIGGSMRRFSRSHSPPSWLISLPLSFSQVAWRQSNSKQSSYDRLESIRRDPSYGTYLNPPILFKYRRLLQLIHNFNLKLLIRDIQRYRYAYLWLYAS